MNINNNSNNVNPIILPRLIQKVTFLNLSTKAKHPAAFSIRLSANATVPLYYTASSGNSKRLVGFRDPDTGLYITDKSLHDENIAKTTRAFANGTTHHGETSAIGSLYRYIIKELKTQIDLKLNELDARQKSNPANYDEIFKPLDLIRGELYDALTDVHSVMTNIYGQIRTIPDLDIPILNSRILYADDDINDIDATKRLPFKNPANQELTKAQKDIVEKFLSVFFDDENLAVFSWMMGTVFLNKPIYASNISRFFLLYSRNGGVGKSTIMQLMTDGLLTSDYSTLVPEFDAYFVNGDKFGSSTLPRKRLVIYDEAVFNGPLDKENMHNFHGLNETSIKSFATTGNLNVEEKFKQQQIDKFYNIHFILTNFLPVIPENRSDLGRRFLDCQLKPTTMQEKAKQLNNMTVMQMGDYVHKHGQAFINYFANEYLSDPKRYDDYAYSHTNTYDEEQDRLDAQKRKQDEIITKLRNLDCYSVLTYIGKDTNADYVSLLSDIRRAVKPYLNRIYDNQKPFTTTNPEFPNIHYEFNTDLQKSFVYLNISKNAFTNYKNGLAMRTALLKIYPRQKRFSQSTICLPLNSEIKRSNNTSLDSISIPLSLINEAKLKQARKLVSQQKDKLQKLDAFDLLNKLSNDLSIDVSDLLADCANALPDENKIKRSTKQLVTHTDKKHPNIHYIADKQGHSSFLCLQTSKQAFSDYKSGLIIREVLSRLYPKVKRFTQKVFMLPIYDYNRFVKSLQTQTDMDQSQTESTEVNPPTQSDKSTDNQDENINTPSVFDTSAVSHTKYENMGIINVFDQLSTTTHVDFSKLLDDVKAYAPTMKQLANNPVYQPKNASQFIYELTDDVLYIYVDKQALNDYPNGDEMYKVLSANIKTINKFDCELFIFRLHDKQ